MSILIVDKQQQGVCKASLMLSQVHNNVIALVELAV